MLPSQRQQVIISTLTSWHFKFFNVQQEKGLGDEDLDLMMMISPRRVGQDHASEGILHT
jgi:hypothetical protein